MAQEWDPNEFIGDTPDFLDVTLLLRVIGDLLHGLSIGVLVASVMMLLRDSLYDDYYYQALGLAGLSATGALFGSLFKHVKRP